MPAIDFNCYATSGIIKIPENYQDWYDKPITVVLLRLSFFLPRSKSILVVAK